LLQVVVVVGLASFPQVVAVVVLVVCCKVVHSQLLLARLIQF
jgi:hypothetical protein